MNIAASAARWSAANWKKATFGWLAFVVAAAAIGHAVGVVQLSNSEQGSGDSARARRRRCCGQTSTGRPTRPCSCRAQG